MAPRIMNHDNLLWELSFLPPNREFVGKFRIWRGHIYPFLGKHVQQLTIGIRCSAKLSLVLASRSVVHSVDKEAPAGIPYIL